MNTNCRRKRAKCDERKISLLHEHRPSLELPDKWLDSCALAFIRGFLFCMVTAKHRAPGTPRKNASRSLKTPQPNSTRSCLPGLSTLRSPPFILHPSSLILPPAPRAKVEFDLCSDKSDNSAIPPRLAGKVLAERTGGEPSSYKAGGEGAGGTYGWRAELPDGGRGVADPACLGVAKRRRELDAVRELVESVERVSYKAADEVLMAAGSFGRATAVGAFRASNCPEATPRIKRQICLLILQRLHNQSGSYGRRPP
jgi:hypothetical protein